MIIVRQMKIMQIKFVRIEINCTWKPVLIMSLTGWENSCTKQSTLSAEHLPQLQGTTNKFCDAHNY